ncbi:MAG: presenilin family intramembrane aspartyl protease [Candidatus Micrarchaeota archaeon]|nr:presenilin family intramembrane aspartyl protease [Candidatus Micrarchaeota archaeon]
MNDFFKDLLVGKNRILVYLLISTMLTIFGLYNHISSSGNALRSVIEEEIEQSYSEINWISLIVNLVFVTIFMIILFKFLHVKKVAMSFEFLVFFFPSLTFFYSMLLPLFMQFDILLLIIGSILLTIIVYFLKQKYVVLKDLMAIISATGIAIIILLVFDFTTIIIFSLFLLVYDIVSVFVTKHMVYFAENIVKYNLPMTVTSYVEIEKEKAKEMIESDIKTNRIEQKDAELILKRIESQERVYSRVDLGSGDLVMFSTLTTINFFANGLVGLLLSLIIGIFSVNIMLEALMKRRTVFPALVAIIPSMILAILVGVLITKLF